MLTENAMKNGSRHVVAVLSFILLLIAVTKILYVAFTSPMLGYANNYDFIRQSNCTGIWQHYKDKPKTSDNIGFPVNGLTYEAKGGYGACLRSIDNLFPSVVAVFHKIGDSFDYKELAFWKVLLTFLSLGFLVYDSRKSVEKFAVAASAALILGDLHNLLYINTLYLEYSVILAVFLCLTLIAITSYRSEKPRLPALITLSLGLVWLGLNKQQYMPLSVCFSLFMVVRYVPDRASRPMAIWFLVLAASIPMAYTQMNRSHSDQMVGLIRANKTDTFLGAVLPAATDKKKALAILGLPAGCEKAIGMDWYRKELHEQKLCPEIEELSRLKLISLFIHDRATLNAVLGKGIIEIRPFYPTYLGTLEKPEIADSILYKLTNETSATVLFFKLPLTVYLWWVLVMLPISLFCIVAVVLGLFPHTLRPGSPLKLAVSMIGLGGACAFYAIFSALYGDGFAELAKHAVVYPIGLSFQIIGVGIALFVGLSSLHFQDKRLSQGAEIT